MVGQNKVARKARGDTKMINFKNTTVWTGKTFDIRSQLKAAGGVWSDAEKTWTVPPVLDRSERMQIERLWLKTDGISVVELAAV